MAIVYFICKCAKKIATDSKEIGRPIQCPSCGSKFIVPHPAITWNCSSCGSEMFATANLMGTVVRCINCGRDSKVPSRITISTPTKGDQPTVKKVPKSSGKELFVVIAILLGLCVILAIPLVIFMQYRPINKAIAQARLASRPAEAVAILQSAINKYPNAPNVQEARALLMAYEEPIVQSMALSNAMAEADTMVAEGEVWGAIDKLKIAIRYNPKAENLKDAQNKIDDLQIKAEHTDALNSTLANVEQLSKVEAISLLENAIKTYPRAINRKKAEEKLLAFRRIVSDTEALKLAMKRAKDYPSSDYALNDLKVAIEKFPNAECLMEANQLYDTLVANKNSSVLNAIGINSASDTVSTTGESQSKDMLSSSESTLTSTEPSQTEKRTEEVSKVDKATSSSSTTNQTGDKDLGSFFNTLSTRIIEETE